MSNDDKGSTLYRFLMFFFAKKFQVHRVGGFLFICQYAATVYLFLFDYPALLESPLTWSLPLTGWIQSVSASLTFTFLPKKKEPGYTAMGDVGAISYFYVLENTYFSLLLLFAWVYFDDRFFPYIRGCWPLELTAVFLMYLPFIRFQWPVSSFRDSLNSGGKGMTKANRRFFVASTYVVKYFYIFAKHFIGFFVNYMRFLGRVGPEEQRLAYGLLIGGSWGTTVALFIHTLKFKGYIGARTGALAYEMSFPWMTYFFFRLAFQIGANLDLALVCIVAVGLNFATTRKRPIWHVYQIVICGCMAAQMYGPEQVGWGPVLSVLSGFACAVGKGMRLDTLRPGASALASASWLDTSNSAEALGRLAQALPSFFSAGAFISGTTPAMDDFKSSL
mmetsp:Transcript_42828/g.86606  ORF Transcript_42828/g.86606 Transcript_42828/m.86606 type:complete len:390 (+) Transcript_42828:178-1347(+)